MVNTRIKTIKWDDFFERKSNKMVVYRVIPKTKVSNSNNNKNLWKLLHKMYEVYDKKVVRVDFKRKKKLGFKVSYREKDNIWSEIIFKSNDGNKTIEFYVATSELFADKFKNVMENKLAVSLEPASVDDIQIPKKNTIVQEMRYIRHDIFSMNTDAKQQTTPIGNVMQTVDDIEDGDVVRLSMCNEVVDRRKWSKLADYAHEKVSNGKIPARARFSALKGMKALGGFFVGIINEVSSILMDTMRAIENSFLRGYKKEGNDFNNTKIEQKKRNLVSELGKERVEGRTLTKKNLPVFKSHIRAAVHSEDKLRRELISNNLSAAYSEIGEDNELSGVRIFFNNKRVRVINELNTLQLTPQTKNDPDVNMISCDELGKLQQYPTRDLQFQYNDMLQVNKRIETELPKIFTHNKGIYAGTSTDIKGEKHEIYVPTDNADNLYQPRTFNGSPGVGKDQALINWVVEAKRKHGIGSVILDVVNEQNGHRGLSNGVRDHVEPDDIIDLDLMDFNNPIYFGLQGIVKNIEDIRIGSDRIAEEITSFLMDGEDDRIQTIDFLREAAKVTAGDPLAIKLMFQSKKYRREMVEKFDDTFDMSIWAEYDKMSDTRQAQIYGPIMRRLGQIMNSEFLKPIFLQSPNPELDLYKWLEQGKIVVIRMKNGVISERIIELICYWIVLNVFLIKLIQDGKGAGTYLILNEPHQFMTDGLVHFLERMLSEGRKYKLAPVFAFQYFKQFKQYPALVSAMIGCNMNWHIFKSTDIETYDKLFPYLKDTFTDSQQAMDTTKKYQYIASWLNAEGEYERPFIVDAPNLVTKRYATKDNSFLTKRHSRVYGRPIKHVLAEIKAKNKLIYADEDAG